ncbi:MAG: cysteine hydrolase [Candidatus Methanoplasma sp.]|jgi:nicotinamidase-related amidase|nr:cysteine hydrolase [Candidatus Methanoplasma sp.]
MTVPDKKDRKIALVIVDVQRKFMGNGRTKIRELTESHLNTINFAIESFREADRPVIFVKFDGNEECVVYDADDGDEYVQGLSVSPKDIAVRKRYMNSFKDSRLAEVVRQFGCDCVLIAGLVAQYCVMATYFGAFDHGITPYIMKGGIIGTDEEQEFHCESVVKLFDRDDVSENLSNVNLSVPREIRRLTESSY